MLSQMLFAEPIGQSWVQLTELALAFVLSALIGLEARDTPEERGPQDLYARWILVRVDHDRLQIWLH